MTKHLTKPIRAIHFMVLAFLMTLSSPLAAQDLREWFLKGSEYYYGVGLGGAVTQDYAEAAKWYRLAAEQGYPNAQFALGFLHEVGHGVLQDKVMSHMWFNIASANGDELAGDSRDETAKKMTRADISKAQAMARECMSSGYQKCGY
ncbi:sel1 repeat family protein [Planktomarina temperata]|nr:sel1 repeat family protein [Planktomarina temperata]